MKKKLIILASLALTLCSAKAGVRDSIDQEIDRAARDNRQAYTGRARSGILCLDPLYSIQKLKGLLLLRDSVCCMDTLVTHSAEGLWECLPNSLVDTAFLPLLELFTLTPSYPDDRRYNLPFYKVYYQLIDGKIPLSSFNNYAFSSDFYKTITSDLPILVSYLDAYQEIGRLTEWAERNRTCQWCYENFMVGMARLGHPELLLAIKPSNTGEWDMVLTGLNYARTKACTDRLVDLLDNHTIIEASTWSDDPDPFFTQVSSDAFCKLTAIVVGFSPEERSIPYQFGPPRLGVIPDEEIRAAKQWFKENPDYEIVRKPNYRY